MLPARVLADYPTGTSVIMRRERPHPGAQLDAFDALSKSVQPAGRRRWWRFASNAWHQVFGMNHSRRRRKLLYVPRRGSR